MKITRTRRYILTVSIIGFVLLLPFISEHVSVHAQGGNTISGQVFGANRTPVADVNVELMDDLSRTLGRARTNAGGRYFFPRLSSGRFKVRVLPYGTEYEEQEQEVEIINFSRGTAGGGLRTSGITNEQKDFYLRIRKNRPLGAAGTVFAQDAPPEAKKLYDAAIADLENNKTKEAYVSLKSSLEVFPTYFAALETLGTEYIKAGFFDAARVLLAMAVDVNPRGYKSWYGLSYALYSLNQFGEARSAAEKATEINAASPESALLLGVLLRQEKRNNEAEKLLLKARELSNSSLPQVHWELALLYANNMKRFADAAKELRLFLKAQPDAKYTEKIRKLIADLDVKAKANNN